TLVQPKKLPNGVSVTGAQAVAPTQLILTLNKAKADAYFKSEGSSVTMPASYNGVQIIVNLPGASVLQYSGPNNATVYLGQAGQLDIQLSDSTINATQMRDFLLQIPGLKSDTVNFLKGLNNWQTTIPLAIPTDRAGWSSTSVGGSVGGPGVILNDNSGLGSA